MVIYILCYDVGSTLETQKHQVAYWLNFLNSTSPLSPSSQPLATKWHIMITGLRADLRHDKAIGEFHQQALLSSLKAQWKCLPIYNQLFIVSSLKSKQSVKMLLQAVEAQCKQIFEAHPLKIPTEYRNALQIMQSIPDDQALLSVEELRSKYLPRLTIESATTLLQYFHAIGRVICMTGGLVFTKPQLAPKMAAKFVSPKEVQDLLLKREDENVQILGTTEVGCLLGTHDAKYTLTIIFYVQ